MKIILIADVPNWAFGRIANHIASESEHDIDVLYSAHFQSQEDLARYLQLAEFDVCHFFWRLYYEKFARLLVQSGNHDALLKKTFTTSVPDYAMLSYDFELANELITRTAAGIVFTNKDLADTYENRYSLHGVSRVINDPLIGMPDAKTVGKKISELKASKFRVSWIGNGNWNGAGHYVDYKGLKNIFQPIVPSLEKHGIEVQIIDSSRGRTNHAAVVSALANSHALCVTSMFEGTSLPVLEAMASGNAIVTTNTGVFSELGSESVDASIVARNSLCFLDAILALNGDRNEWERQAIANLKTISATKDRRDVALWDRFFADVADKAPKTAKAHFIKPQTYCRTSALAPEEGNEIVCITSSRWHGVRNSSMTLFQKILALPEDPKQSINKFDTDDIVAMLEENHKDAPIVISGGDDFHRKLFSDHLEFFAKKQTTLLWHGSATQWQEEVHYTQFSFWNDHLTLGNLKGICFFKKDMFDIFSRRGRRVHYLSNYIPASVNGNDILRRKARYRSLVGKSPIRIGVLSAANHPLKNPTTQILAAGLACRGKLDVAVPDGLIFERIQNSFKINLVSIGTGLTQAEHSRAIEVCDIVLYATFTECSPMIPLESAQLGIPCLVSEAANIYTGYDQLEELLVVKRPDDVSEIRGKIERIIDEYSRIVEAMHSFYLEQGKDIVEMHRSYYNWCRGSLPHKSGEGSLVSSFKCDG